MLIELDNEMPDGICADAEDHIWFASPFTGEVIRVTPGGKIAARVSMPRSPYACMLGGHDGRTLFICVSGSWQPDEARASRAGQILAMPVDVPGPAAS